MSASDAVDNIILLADSYKVTHHLQYPPDTTYIYSYFESRGGKFEKTLFFGLQYILKHWLSGPVVTLEKIAEAKSVFEEHLGQNVFNEEGWKYIVEEHGGYLPLRIKAVPEGTLVPFKNVLFTVENTDPKCFWLTNYVETLLVQTWYPMTVATNSFYQKKLLAEYLSETADNSDCLMYQLHDFGYRGVSSVESAGIGGAAHLVNFRGTDTVAALMMVRKFYGCRMAGVSIPAAEHSTITTWGRHQEKEAFQNMLDRIPNGAISIVSDSYDVFNACKEIWGKALKDCVVERGNRDGRVVIRPDSGKPEDVIITILEILEKQFGAKENSKGFRVLPSYVRIIQGDGISYESLPKILERMKEKRWSTENLVFGSGGALLQRLDRDTQKCAFKCSSAVIGGEMVDVFKEPITDPGKKSKRGRLCLLRQGDTYVTKEACPRGDPNGDAATIEDVLVTVFENGKLVKDYGFDEVRERADQECRAECRTLNHKKKL